VELGCWTFRSFCLSAVIGAHNGAHANVVLAENFEYGKCPTPGLLQPRTYNFYFYPELLLDSNVKPIEKYLAFEPQSGTKCQLHSQGKLTTPRRENRKIRHKNVFLIANERLHKVSELKTYEMEPIKHMCKSCETIP
jgi:hypothetical protein